MLSQIGWTELEVDYHPKSNSVMVLGQQGFNINVELGVTGTPTGAMAASCKPVHDASLAPYTALVNVSYSWT